MAALAQHNSKNIILISVNVFSTVMLVSVLVKVQWICWFSKLKQRIAVKVIKYKAFLKNTEISVHYGANIYFCMKIYDFNIKL